MMTSKAIRTPLTRLLGIQTPVVGAPMAGAAGGKLASMISSGGGFGFIGTGYESLDTMREQFSLAKQVVQRLPSGKLPIGLGALAWILDNPERSNAALSLLDLALEESVQAIWLSFGDDIPKWIKYVRDRDPTTLIFVQVNSVEDAVRAATEYKADVIIAQGNEAGGHGVGSAPPTFILLPAVLQSVPPETIVLAAGGISIGSQIAALLTLGASGVVLGTRFLLTPESLYQPAQKDALSKAGLNDTTRSMAFDELRGTLGWPAGVDGRGIGGNIVKDYDKGLELEERKKNYKEGTDRNDAGYVFAWSGAGVGLLKHAKPAAEVLQDLHAEVIASLSRVPSLLS